MTYQEALEYLYSATPVFEQTGGDAYKPGLDNIQALDAHYQHPHHKFKTIHVGGTNGKGSVSHSIAAVLQASGYKVGLFTSPHLVDFRERIRINGEMISREFVADFTSKAQAQISRIKPSFFELTTMMAFCYFAEQGVDVAVIEVGLGGRLDSTNIILPVCSIITSISLDHTQYLGDSLQSITEEKAGIIKPHTPIILGDNPEEVTSVIEQVATRLSTPCHLASEWGKKVIASISQERGKTIYSLTDGLVIHSPLMGQPQQTNMKTILSALAVLSKHFSNINPENISIGLQGVLQLTGLRGRFERLTHQGLRILCDTAHNPQGISFALEQIHSDAKAQNSFKHIILSLSSDKDISAILKLLPKDEQRLRYYFTQSSSHRSLPYLELTKLANSLGIEGEAYPTLPEAYQKARTAILHLERDEIVILGSNFLVGDFLTYIQQQAPEGKHNANTAR